MKGEYGLTPRTKELWDTRWKRMKHIHMAHWTEFDDNKGRDRDLDKIVEIDVDPQACAKRLEHFRNRNNGTGDLD
jgi:hypothetical protein